MIKRNWRTLFILVTFAVDTLGIVLSGGAAYYSRQLFPNLPEVPVSIFYSVGATVWFIFLFFALVLGLYRASYHTNLNQQYRIAWKTWLYAILCTLSLFYFLQRFDLPRRFILLLFLFVPIFFAIGRSVLHLFNLAMQKRGYGIRNALIFGYDAESLEIFNRFKGFPELGYEIKGIITKEKVDSKKKVDLDGVKLATFSIAKLPSLVESEHIERIFVPSPNSLANGASALINLCKLQGMKVKVLSPETDKLLNITRIHDIAGIPLYSPPRTKVQRVKQHVKRLTDIIGSLLLIALLSPIFIVASLAIYIESGRPIIFKQRRSSSSRGKEFFFYKFRSMIKNADEMKAGLLQFNESSGVLFKLKDDPRMTRVGKFIRKYSVDELPQLFNVLKGDMSLVGPRPLPIKDFEKLKTDHEFDEALKTRENAKPGITGLWQISGRSNVGFKEMLLLDCYYIENQTVLFDLEIIFATIPVVLFGRGAY